MRPAGPAALVAVVGVLAMLLAGCADDAATNPETTVEIMADYPWYPTVTELTEAAGLVVVGTVTGRQVVWMDTRVGGEWIKDPELNPQYGAPEGESGEGSEHLDVVTLYEVDVETVAEGSATAGDVIRVAESGGEIDGVSYVTSNPVDLAVGDTYLLFLGGVGGDPWWVVNPDQGAYVQTDDGGYAATSPDNPLDGWSVLEAPAS